MRQQYLILRGPRGRIIMLWVGLVIGEYEITGVALVQAVDDSHRGTYLVSCRHKVSDKEFRIINDQSPHNTRPTCRNTDGKLVRLPKELREIAHSDNGALLAYALGHPPNTSS